MRAILHVFINKKLCNLMHSPFFINLKVASVSNLILYILISALHADFKTILCFFVRQSIMPLFEFPDRGPESLWPVFRARALMTSYDEPCSRTVQGLANKFNWFYNVFLRAQISLGVDSYRLLYICIA